MPAQVQRCRVVAPSRLHFGLLSFGGAQQRQFGGAGFMLTDPCCEVQMQTADSFGVGGESSDRVRMFAERWSQFHAIDLPECHLEVVKTLPGHVGLGSGTQLALATATALNQVQDGATKTFDERVGGAAALASSVGRGLRSAVGTYGFCVGGFIAEPGKEPDETLAPLGCRVAVPETWRVALIRPVAQQGVSGDAEKAAFSRLPPVPVATTEKLKGLVHDEMIPALEAADCERFGEAVYTYGVTAGNCFALCQGGPFASPDLAAIVDFVRSLGVTGVGQSSWGPTLFAILPNRSEGEKLRGQLSVRFGSTIDVRIASPNNAGAEVSVLTALS